MLFAWKVAKHVKSNAIVYAKNNATVGIGAGQMSRVDSAKIASQKNSEMEKSDENSSLENTEEQNQFLKLVKDITSKGFVRSNYEEKLVDLSDVRINLKSKN